MEHRGIYRTVDSTGQENVRKEACSSRSITYLIDHHQTVTVVPTAVKCRINFMQEIVRPLNTETPQTDTHSTEPSLPSAYYSHQCPQFTFDEISATILMWREQPLVYKRHIEWMNTKPVYTLICFFWRQIAYATSLGVLNGVRLMHLLHGVKSILMYSTVMNINMTPYISLLVRLIVLTVKP